MFKPPHSPNHPPIFIHRAEYNYMERARESRRMHWWFLLIYAIESIKDSKDSKCSSNQYR